MSSILRSFGENVKGDFQGNLMFISADHIKRKRASALCDLFSLLCVAFQFITASLPWLDEIEALNESTDNNYYEKNQYIELRLKKKDSFN